MRRILDNLEPRDFFHYFEDICNIPHVSYHTEKMSDYCENFAKEHGLKYVRDDAGNVVIYKPATPGYEEHPAVIIQGHIDMVGAKTDESGHNFLTDSIKLDEEALSRGVVTAIGTTLGGDDGVAVAYAMAILASTTLKHPAIEAVFTVDEEVGLLGAKAFDTSLLSGRYFLNLDSEDEGSILIGCAGGLRSDLKLPVNMAEYEGTKLRITICNLTGGHSGTEIGTGRPSANILMGRLLKSIDDYEDYYLMEIEGGVVDNAIAQKCSAVIVCEADAIPGIEQICDRVCSELKNEYAGIEDNITALCEREAQGCYRVADDIGREKILCLLTNLLQGVIARNPMDVNLVETSLNMGVLKFSDGLLTAGYCVRSSIESAKRNLADRIGYLTEFLGGEYEESGDYPAWPCRQDSKLPKIAAEVYKEMYGKDVSLQTIHAGLECAIFADKMPELDIISYGPIIKDIHTFDEELDIESAKRVYDFTVRLLEAL